MKIRFLMAALVVGVGLSGCKLEVGDGDGGSGIAAGFSIEWVLSDYNTEASIDCAQAGADFVEIVVNDADGVTHEYYWECNVLAGETEWEIATGDASVEANLLAGDILLSTVTFSHTFESGTLSNDLGLVDFAVELYDPVSQADASIEWQWGTGTSSAWDYLSSTDCENANIDYVYLWVWNPITESWWGDSEWTEFSCEAVDHGDGFDPWSGLHIEDFLEADEYQLYLGFYKELTEYESDEAAQLMYYDTRGMAEDGLSGELLADDETADGYNDLGVTLINPDEEEFGVLKINLIWEQSDGTPNASCADSSVAVMGFLLRNDGWVAAEVPLNAGLECLDWLQFEDLPVLSDAYELLVSGATSADEVLWYNLCTGLDPEVDVTLEDADGYTCDIEHVLAP